MKVVVKKTVLLTGLRSELAWLESQGIENFRRKKKSYVTEISFLAEWPSAVLFERGYRPADRVRVRVSTEKRNTGTKALEPVGMRPSKQDEENALKHDERLFNRASPVMQKAIVRWRKRNRSEQIGAIGGKKAKGPMLNSATPKSRTQVRLHCAYCNEFGSPRILVIGRGGDAFLCAPCFERAREYSRLPGTSDAMHKAWVFHEYSASDSTRFRPPVPRGIGH